MAATTADQRVINALGYLLWSYLDRVAAGDTARATAILRSFQTVYTQYSGVVKTIGTNVGLTPPGTLRTTGIWSSAEILPAQIILARWLFTSDASRARLLPIVEAMPPKDIELATWFPGLIVSTASGDTESLQAVADMWAAVPVAELPARLTLDVGKTLAGEPIVTTPAFAQDPFGFVRQTAQRATEAITDPLEVVGRGIAPQMPVWGWIALAVGGVSAAGILVWGLMGKRKVKS